ncbi:hypothetical protein [Sclerotinia sclerotiorum reovirus 1]|nr:hypothetical protein [Sclerotinia sclerotiorum reovirus 1]
MPAVRPRDSPMILCWRFADLGFRAFRLTLADSTILTPASLALFSFLRSPALASAGSDFSSRYLQNVLKIAFPYAISSVSVSALPMRHFV